MLGKISALGDMSVHLEREQPTHAARVAEFEVQRLALEQDTQHQLQQLETAKVTSLEKVCMCVCMCMRVRASVRSHRQSFDCTTHLICMQLLL